MHSARSCRPAKKPTRQEIQSPGVVAEAAAGLGHAVGRAGSLRVPATGLRGLHDAGRRVVFPAAKPHPTVKLLQQLLVAKVDCHRCRAKRSTVGDDDQIPQAIHWRDERIAATRRPQTRIGDWDEVSEVIVWFLHVDLQR